MDINSFINMTNETSCMPKAANEFETSFRTDVGDLFRLFSLPRMEYYSRGETGFWDLTDSFQFGDMFLKQVHQNIILITENYFEHKSEELLEPVNSALGNYMSGEEELSVQLSAKSMHTPIGIKTNNEFIEGKKTATITRNRGENEHAFSKSDLEMFDWLYGTYTQGNTNIYNEPNFTLTLSIKNTKDFVDYSVNSGNYNNCVREWDMPPENNTILQKIGLR